MAEFATGNIRNIALMGHGSEGKTTLTEAMHHRVHLFRRIPVKQFFQVSPYSGLIVRLHQFHQRFLRSDSLGGKSDQRDRRSRIL